MVREPNAPMCRWDRKPVLRCPQTVCIPFTENKNLSVLWANTKRTGYAGCPFHAPVVLCSPQVHGKLINCAPHANGAAHKQPARVYKALDFSNRAVD